MRDAYEVLGVPRGAVKEQIDAAYREKMRLAGGDAAKVEELNNAYDEIIAAGSPFGQYRADYSDVRMHINSDRIEEAQVILDGVPENLRNAEWYYLKGTVQQKRGWLEEALKNFETACNMEPLNETYQRAYTNVNNMSSGGYRTERRQSQGRGCSGCEICEGLICLDCCCESLGGDCIPCC